MIEQMILIGLVVTALAALLTRSLRRSVIHLSIFSLLSSFVFLIYQAPDVAIAEAVIGCGLATALFLVALKRQRLITIYYLQPGLEQISDRTMPSNTARLFKDIETFYAGKDRAIQIIHSAKERQDVVHSHKFDLMVIEDETCLEICSQDDECYFDELRACLATMPVSDRQTRITRFNKGGN